MERKKKKEKKKKTVLDKFHVYGVKANQHPTLIIHTLESSTHKHTYTIGRNDYRASKLNIVEKRGNIKRAKSCYMFVKQL